jgi:hypothetical protein
MGRVSQLAKSCRKVKKFLAVGPVVDILFKHISRFYPPIWLRGKKFMLSSVAGELDFIEELRLRRWARQHYVARGHRDLTWHPVILDEMDRKDLEMNEADEVVATCA